MLNSAVKICSLLVHFFGHRLFRITARLKTPMVFVVALCNAELICVCTANLSFATPNRSDLQWLSHIGSFLRVKQYEKNQSCVE